jgi:KaiC/GvpD/RAD55 family RecA-like ATPase
MYQNFLKYVRDGREGLNKGIPMGFPRLDKYLRGIQKKKFYLIGAETGCGKTGFADEAFILNPYKHITENNVKETLKIFYYSFEIDLESKLAKWVSYQIFQDHKIEIDPEHIVGMDMQHDNDVENRLSDEHYNLVASYEEYFEKLFSHIEFEDIALNPTGIKKQVEKYCIDNGTMPEYDKKVEGIVKKIPTYKPNKPNEYVIVIIDHYSLIKSESEKGIKLNKKLSMDKLCSYLIELRNKYKISPVVVSQFNRELGDIQRQKFKELTPQLTDFKETGNSQEDANVVLALMHPKRHNLDNYQDYVLKGIDYDITDNFRMGFIIKNRGGRDGVKLAFRFLGICGYFEEIPIAKEFNENPQWYKKIKDFSKPFLELIKTKTKK